ncbi:P2X purinoceptor 4-like [Montipora capricornis]|uniref:P2X purinoceptor 4-like n=1 Tax=Montipora capricornis TaxID=246305 RepID=UPI0035F1D223
MAGKNEGGFFKALSDVFFEYDTSKVVHIKSKTIGITNRLVQLSIICYIIIYVIIIKKGYQDTEKPYSSVTTKVKGTSLTNLTHILGNDSFPLYGGIHVWDSSDYVVPPQETEAFFVMTNMIITPSQTQTTCPEDPDETDVNCTKDSDCPAGKPVKYGHGVNTGKCVQADRGSKPRKHVCQIYAWCPVEVDVLPMPQFNLTKGVPLLETENFTVLIKNTVSFPKFKESRRNIPQESSLKKCMYDPVEDPLCPIIKLGTIVKEAGEDYKTLAYKGGVMAIIINWDCDFDPLTYTCQPNYSFVRLDDSESPIAPGYNFRFARFYEKDGMLYRSLFKAYGIRFVVMVYGQGGKFSIVPLLVNLGSGLALLGIATVLCDIVVLYVVKGKTYYRTQKYQYVQDPNFEPEKKSLLHSGSSSEEGKR